MRTRSRGGRSSRLRHDCRRQAETKDRAAWSICGCPQAAAMGFNDGATDGQSHAGAVRLRREERIEDVLRAWGEANAHVSDADQQVMTVIIIMSRRDGDLALAVNVLHRLDTVHH